LVWVVEHQGARRNMTAEARTAIAKKLADKGLTVKEIAEKLHTSESTVNRDIRKAPLSDGKGALPTPSEQEKPANGNATSGTAKPNPRPLKEDRDADAREPKVCERCIRTNGGRSVRDCGRCADLNAGKRQKNTNGQPITFDWNDFFTKAGRLMRAIGDCGEACGGRDKFLFMQQRKNLQSVIDGVRAAWKQHKGTEAPEQ
jgi:hypothetical protein